MLNFTYQEAEKAFREMLEPYEGEFGVDRGNIVFKGRSKDGREFRAGIAEFDEFISVDGELKEGDCRGFGSPCFDMDRLKEEIEYAIRFCGMIKREATQLKLW